MKSLPAEPLDLQGYQKLHFERKKTASINASLGPALKIQKTWVLNDTHTGKKVIISKTVT
jgi:hypothetical protein